MRKPDPFDTMPEPEPVYLADAEVQDRVEFLSREDLVDDEHDTLYDLTLLEILRLRR